MQPFIQRRRASSANAWDLRDEIVLIRAGAELPMPGRFDQLYPFRVHPEYFYLTDRQRPGSVLAFDPQEGWVHFVPRPTEAERIWGGGADDGAGDAPEATALEELEGWLARRRGRRVAMLGAGTSDAEADELTVRLREQLSDVRRAKDEEELRRIRLAVAATEEGFRLARRLIRPGATERQLQIELEAEMFRRGAERVAYETIVASGPNSAVLHFLPTSRELRPSELVVIDAGAEVGGYVADVTRTFPVAGRFTPEQRDLYELVLAAQSAAIPLCRAGVEFREVHLRAALLIARGLVDFGLLRGDAESLVEQGAHALFFPHGVGHLVGLGVRDAGGQPRRAADGRGVIPQLRLDLPLRPGFVVTVEPGIYFIPALLRDRARRERFRQQVAWERADRMLGFGGIRIEDNVLVTAAAPDVLTIHIPKLLIHSRSYQVSTGPVDARWH